MNHFFNVYHRVDGGSDDMYETCMKTFRNESDATISTITDNVPIELMSRWESIFDVRWTKLPSMKGKRAYAKIDYLRIFMDFCKDGDVIFVGDIDLYFLAEPFPEFGDFAITKRCYKYYKPINGGCFWIRVSDKMRKFMDWHLKWSRMAESRYGLDWTVGQSFLCHVAQKQRMIEKEYGIKVDVLGAEWNYCPGCDVYGVETAKQVLMNAYNGTDGAPKTGRLVKILHLKSELKGCLYDGWLPDAVTTNGPGEWNWQKNGA